MRQKTALVFVVFILLGTVLMPLEISAEEELDFKLGATHSSTIDDVMALGSIRYSSRSFTLGDINDITRARYRFALDNEMDYFIHNLVLSIYNEVNNSEESVIGAGLNSLLIREYVIRDFTADIEGLGLSISLGLQEKISAESELYLEAEVLPAGIFRIPSLEREGDFTGYGINLGFDYKLRDDLNLQIGGIWQKYNFSEEKLSDMSERLGGIYAGVTLTW